jgi:hypothetical protein
MTEDLHWFEQLLELQLKANPLIWDNLRSRGMTPDSELRLAFLYVAPGQSEAEQLEAFLRDETDYVVKAHSQRESRFAQRDWFVAGTTQPAVITLATVNEWVEWMIAAGASNGPCAFDGWAGQLAGEEPGAA